MHGNCTEQNTPSATRKKQCWLFEYVLYSSCGLFPFHPLLPLLAQTDPLLWDQKGNRRNLLLYVPGCVYVCVGIPQRWERKFHLKIGSHSLPTPWQRLSCVVSSITSHYWSWWTLLSVFGSPAETVRLYCVCFFLRSSFSPSLFQTVPSSISPPYHPPPPQLAAQLASGCHISVNHSATRYRSRATTSTFQLCPRDFVDASPFPPLPLHNFLAPSLRHRLGERGGVSSGVNVKNETFSTKSLPLCVWASSSSSKKRWTL